jgi:hypothetical protein
MSNTPSLSYTNCCHPVQLAGFLAPAQTDAEVLKWFELIWSVKALGPAMLSVSLVTPVTLLNEPSAVVMYGTFAEKSLPLPTISGLAPLAGG